MYFEFEHSLDENVGIDANDHIFVENLFLTIEVVDINSTYTHISGIVKLHLNLTHQMHRTLIHP